MDTSEEKSGLFDPTDNLALLGGVFLAWRSRPEAPQRCGGPEEKSGLSDPTDNLALLGGVLLAWRSRPEASQRCGGLTWRSRNNIVIKPIVTIQNLGRVAYPEAWDLQTRLRDEVVARKRAKQPQSHYLLFVEHPPVYTLGKSGSEAHLLLDEVQLRTQGFEFHRINRGGDITYHGPGQLVVYPIFDLAEFEEDVHKYVRNLEEVIIRTLTDYGIVGERDAGYTGVWLAGDPARRQPKRKICAIGVHLSRWTTMHGLAFNVRPNLTHFANIVPCGIAEADRSVTSLSVELGRPVELDEVRPRVLAHFRDVFGF